jgi:hypothetical protein
MGNRVNERPPPRAGQGRGAAGAGCRVPEHPAVAHLGGTGICRPSPSGTSSPSWDFPTQRQFHRLRICQKFFRARESSFGAHAPGGRRFPAEAARPILAAMRFRDRLLATLAAIKPVLTQPGVMVVGSEVPNLLQPEAASTLVVSQGVDVAVPIEAHREVKAALREVHGFRPSADEPSVWAPLTAGLLEVNFVGRDVTTRDASDTRVLEDPELPLMVFGLLSHLRPGPPVVIEGMAVPVPRPAGLMIEKLLTDRTGEKGDRDLLVVLALLLLATPADLDELPDRYLDQQPEERYAIRSNLTLLALLAPRPGMPDPEPERGRVVGLLRRLERLEGGQ